MNVLIARVSVFLMAVGLLASSANAGVIDFEHLPSGASPTVGSLVADSYAEWGVTFRSVGVSDMPCFSDSYSSDGLAAHTLSCVYPPGFNIVADFSIPVNSIRVDLAGPVGWHVTMIAKDSTGAVIASVVSDPTQDFWVRGVSLSTTTPIASVEWWPQASPGIVGIDNLFFTPEPATLSLLALGGLAMLARRRRAA